MKEMYEIYVKGLKDPAGLVPILCDSFDEWLPEYLSYTINGKKGFIYGKVICIKPVTVTQPE